jgi:4-amino-4-deoxy-L-arabinose transferase-like glycosyltransferase
MFVYWGLAVIVLLRSLFWRHRSQALMGILYVAAGLSLLGKGLIGPGLVGAVVLAHLVVSGRWDLLRKCGLPTGLVLFALASFPWHHAMILYRGEPWIQELVIENNLRRFSTGEQAQAVGSFAYYLETLGLAALPWSAVVPVAVWGGIRAFARKSRSPTGVAQACADDSGTGLLQLAVLWLAVSLFMITFSTTKYYHYLLCCLPPLALVIAARLGCDGRRKQPTRTALAGALVGLGILITVVRDAINSPAWLAHLTTYAYTGFWTEGAPAVNRIGLAVAPFGLGLLLWPLGRRRLAIGAYVVSGLLTTAYVIDDYLPAASENWSQRTALRIYFDEREPHDRLVSWAFYYRGETFFTKADVWVMKYPDRRQLADYIADRQGSPGALWVITLESKGNRLSSQLPPEHRDSIEEVYRNFHYVLLRVTLRE